MSHDIREDVIFIANSWADGVPPVEFGSHVGKINLLHVHCSVWKAAAELIGVLWQDAMPSPRSEWDSSRV